MFEREDQPIGRDRAALEYNVQQFEEIESSVYLGTYLARVAAQSADLATVDVEIEPDLPPDKRKIAGLVRVPLFGGAPAHTVDIEPDRQCFCAVSFLNGDRTKPFVLAWQSTLPLAQRIDLRADEVRLGCTGTGPRRVARNNDPTGNGAIAFASNPGSPTQLQIVYTPPSGAPQTVTLTMPGPVSGGGSIAISGTITDGSPTVRTD
ncbi:MAG: hypothetical protein JNK05_37710 [Myxococcales bacterium]|nr:hypothetical protein [Myxococcales bacterium]